MDLRKLLKCPVTVALLILWAALSVVGYLGKDTIYKNYTVDIRTTPYFVLVFDGLHEDVYKRQGRYSIFAKSMPATFHARSFSASTRGASCP